MEDAVYGGMEENCGYKYNRCSTFAKDVPCRSKNLEAKKSGLMT